MVFLIEKDFVFPYLVQDMRASLDDGNSLSMPDGILINGFGPEQAVFDFEPGYFSLRHEQHILSSTILH